MSHLDEVVDIGARVRASSLTKPAWYDVEPGTYLIADVGTDPADPKSETVTLLSVTGGEPSPPLVTRTSRGQTALGDLIWGK